MLYTRENGRRSRREMRLLNEICARGSTHFREGLKARVREMGAPDALEYTEKWTVLCQSDQRRIR